MDIGWKRISKILSYLSAFFGAWTLIRSPSGIVGGVMWLPKLWAGAWAPVLAMAGGLGTLIGLACNERGSIWAGLFGAALGLRHTVKVTKPHDGFAQAFGLDWEARIRPDLRARLSPSRYRLVQAKPPMAHGQRDAICGLSETGDPLLCDIWEPPNEVRRTGVAVIYLHGGAWQALDKGFFTKTLFQRLAGQGHVIVDVAYSLAPKADLYDMMGDVKRAIAWTKAHAIDYEVDPDRIALIGASGGGHLALLAAYTPNHPAFQPRGVEADTSVRGVVSLYGITDLIAFFHEYGQSNPKQPEYSFQITDDLRPRVHDRTVLDRLLTRARIFPAYRHANMPGGPLLLVYLLGSTPKEIPEVYRLGSPIAHVGPQCPPTLQLFGDNDFVSDPSHGRRLHQALCEAGIPSIYVEFPDTVHAFDHYFGVLRRVAPAAQAAAYDIERFLAWLST